MTKQQEQEEQDDRTHSDEIYASMIKDKNAEIVKLTGELDLEQTKINRLDIQIANLKDENAKLDNIKENLLKSFQELYSLYQQLYEQVTSSNTALTITAGKLAEVLVRTKFTIPQQEQPQL